DQRGIDVLVDVFAPIHRRVFRADSPNGDRAPENVHVLADHPGRYRLEVAAVKPGAQGRYLARIAALRPASLADRERCTAQQAAAEAKDLALSPDSFWEAAAKYEKALRLWQELGDLESQVWALDALGLLYFEHGRSGDA